MMILGALLAGGLMSASSLHAQPVPIESESGGGRVYQRWESPPWQVLAGDDYCAADLEVPNIQFAVELYWWTGEVRLQVASGNWLSLRHRSGGPARLSLSLDGFSAWSSDEATIFGNEQVGGFLMDLSAPHARSVTSRLANARVIEITAEGRTLGSHALENVQEAMRELELCARLMRANDQTDPFARPG